jgi:peptidoglycan hydrolase CwlO-like protein
MVYTDGMKRQTLQSVKEEIITQITDIIKEEVSGLAIATANGFNDVYKRLDNVENEIINMRHDIKRIDSDVLEINSKIDNIDQKIFSMTVRMSTK